MEEIPKEKIGFLKRLFHKKTRPTVIVKQRKSSGSSIDIDSLVARIFEYYVVLLITIGLTASLVKLINIWFFK